MKKKVRILSIDGGGIRGILPAMILNKLEQTIQHIEGANARLADYFDLIAGTSTGGIIAGLLLVPDKNGRPKYRAKDALDLYQTRGHEIFNIELWDRIKTLGGLGESKYPVKELERHLANYFGETRLGDLLRPCLIPAYDVTKRKAIFFNKLDASNPKRNFLVKDVLRATSAAPTYFETALIKSEDQTHFPLIDGGVVANNPAMDAYVEARNIRFSELPNGSGRPNYPKVEDMIIISLGTGSEKIQYHYDKVKSWGQLEWIRPIIDILMSGNEETVNYQLRALFNTTNYPGHFVRMDPSLGNASTELDDASSQNVLNLLNAGNAFVEQEQNKIYHIAEMLIKNK